MNSHKNTSRTIWPSPNDPKFIEVIDQRFLPFESRTQELRTGEDSVVAIKDMVVRGAPLIGVVAAYGMYLAALEGKTSIEEAAQKLKLSRPTAINLSWAVDQQLKIAKNLKGKELVAELLASANRICDLEVQRSKSIGEHGLLLLREIAKNKKDAPINILTHCNAGWLACVEYGTALAPIYLAHREGIKLHIWVDETRPRNQGASLTAWELQQQNIPHTVIVDNAGGLLMMRGLVDFVIVGTDRVAKNGDVVNKIGTYLKALAAFEHKIPFYVAAPWTSIDLNIGTGAEIPIEERGGDEVSSIQGWSEGKFCKVKLVADGSPAINYGFDVTPAKFITGLITERGVCHASAAGIQSQL